MFNVIYQQGYPCAYLVGCVFWVCVISNNNQQLCLRGPRGRESLTFSGHEVENTENQSVLPSVIRVKHCSGIRVSELQFVFYLRETFPESMSRTSHVRLAEEPDGRRLPMAHTCTEERSSVTQKSKYRLVLAFENAAIPQRTPMLNRCLQPPADGACIRRC